MVDSPEICTRARDRGQTRHERIPSEPGRGWFQVVKKASQPVTEGSNYLNDLFF